MRDTSSIFKRCNRVLIGHNRWASSGQVNRRNAHPFEFDEIVGVHNGTLQNKYNLDNHQAYDVDSEALFDNIERFGIKEAIGKARGAWALVWYNKEEKSLNFLRNKERPLFYTYSENKKTILWASEAWMLTHICKREDYKIGEIYTVTEDLHYKWNVDLDNSLFEKPIQEGVLGLPPIQQQHYKGGMVVSITNAKLPKQQAVGQNQYETLLDHSYLGKTIQCFVGGEFKDECGCPYLICDDPSEVGKDLRLYFHNNNIIPLKEATITVKVVGAKRVNGSRQIFYKLDFDSIKIVEEIVQVIVKNRDGVELTEKELEQYYHTCCWCSSPIDHKQKGNTYLSRDAGALCPDCSYDEQILQYL